MKKNKIKISIFLLIFIFLPIIICSLFSTFKAEELKNYNIKNNKFIFEKFFNLKNDVEDLTNFEKEILNKYNNLDNDFKNQNNFYLNDIVFSKYIISFVKDKKVYKVNNINENINEEKYINIVSTSDEVSFLYPLIISYEFLEYIKNNDFLAYRIIENNKEFIVFKNENTKFIFLLKNGVFKICNSKTLFDDDEINLIKKIEENNLELNNNDDYIIKINKDLSTFIFTDNFNKYDDYYKFYQSSIIDNINIENLSLSNSLLEKKILIKDNEVDGEAFNVELYFYLEKNLNHVLTDKSIFKKETKYFINKDNKEFIYLVNNNNVFVFSRKKYQIKNGSFNNILENKLNTYFLIDIKDKEEVSISSNYKEYVEGVGSLKSLTSETLNKYYNYKDTMFFYKKAYFDNIFNFNYHYTLKEDDEFTNKEIEEIEGLDVYCYLFSNKIKDGYTNFKNFKEEYEKEIEQNKKDELPTYVIYTYVKLLKINYLVNGENKQYKLSKDLVSKEIEESNIYFLDENDNIKIQTTYVLKEILKPVKTYEEIKINEEKLKEEIKKSLGTLQGFDNILKYLKVKILTPVFNKALDKINYFNFSVKKYDFGGWSLNEISFNDYMDKKIYLSQLKDTFNYDKGIIKLKLRDIKDKNELNLYSIYVYDQKLTNKVEMSKIEQFIINFKLINKVDDDVFADIDLALLNKEYKRFVQYQYIAAIRTVNGLKYELLKRDFVLPGEAPEFYDFNSANTLISFEKQNIIKELKKEYAFIGYTLKEIKNDYGSISNSQKLRNVYPIYTSNAIKDLKLFKNNEHIKLFNEQEEFLNSNQIFYAVFLDHKLVKSIAGVEITDSKNDKEIGSDIKKSSQKEKVDEIKKNIKSLILTKEIKIIIYSILGSLLVLLILFVIIKIKKLFR